MYYFITQSNFLALEIPNWGYWQDEVPEEIKGGFLVGIWKIKIKFKNIGS